MTDLAHLDLGALDALQPGAGSAIKAAFRLLAHLASINDRRATAEFREQMDGITADNAANLDRVVTALERMLVREDHWKGEPSHMRPTREDVLDRYVDYARAHQKAGHHGKRRMLWNGLFSSFDPGFYKSGMATLLWNIAKQLEYPEVRMLTELIRGPYLEGGQPRSTIAEWLRQRLVQAGLVYHDRGRHTFMASDLGLELQKFAWDDDMWNLDDDANPPQPGK